MATKIIRVYRTVETRVMIALAQIILLPISVDTRMKLKTNPTLEERKVTTVSTIERATGGFPRRLGLLLHI